MKSEMFKLKKPVCWAFALAALLVQTALGSYDNFADAYQIPSGATSFTFSNEGNTKESGEPTHSSDDYQGGASGWAIWTAPATGEYTFWLAGSDNDYFDTQLAIYTGTSVQGLSLVASNDDSPLGGYSSMLSFKATAGVKYKIAMDSYNGVFGNMTLRWAEGVEHYLQFSGYGDNKVFAPVSGGDQEIDVVSSANWSVVSSSSWITMKTDSGTNGSKLSFTVAANATGSTRTGTITLKVGSSMQVTLYVWQHVLDYVTSKATAESKAKASGKRILLIYGREGCWNTRTTFFSSFPTDEVKQLIASGYIVWYSNCDRQNEASGYSAGLADWYLPLICIINPANNMSTYVARETGYHDANAMLTFLQNNSSGVATTWTVTYRPGANGTGAYQTATKTKDVALTLKGAIFTRSGYTQTGWSTSDGGSKAYNLGVSYTANASITLYPFWTQDKRDTYTVRYRKYDGSGETAKEQFECGKTYRLAWLGSELGWMRSGYEFCGWVPWNPDAKPRICKYENGQPVKDLAAAGETIDLWAGWKSPSSYRVCFHRCAGPDDLTKMNQVILRNKEDNLAWMDSQIGWKREGYTFMGWSESESSKTVKYANGAKVKNLAMDGGTKHLYGVWRANGNFLYKVRFNKYDGTGSTAIEMLQFGKEQRLLWLDSQLGWSREGYEFCGWVPWNPDTKPRLCKYVNGQLVVDLVSDYNGVLPTINLWAAWKSKSSYRVCLNRNDGTGVKMNQVILRNKEDNLAWMDSQIGWKREGYVFKGWAETANGAVKYANGAKVKNLAMDGGTKHLYAIWRVAD